jgi:hypothetical protein
MPFDQDEADLASDIERDLANCVVRLTLARPQSGYDNAAGRRVVATVVGVAPANRQSRRGQDFGPARSQMVEYRVRAASLPAAIADPASGLSKGRGTLREVVSDNAGGWIEIGVPMEIASVDRECGDALLVIQCGTERASA